ncbi:MAG: helix-turn-helix domain-containing protein [Parvibaculaceae bacterium]
MARGSAGGISADLVSALRSVIQGLLPNDNSRIESAAAVVCMSVRTLQRRLASTGVSYSDLVDQERLVRALALIDDPSVKLGKIAGELGYADAANFVRAFRRWTGFSPSQVRAFDRESRVGLMRELISRR